MFIPLLTCKASLSSTIAPVAGPPCSVPHTWWPRLVTSYPGKVSLQGPSSPRHRASCGAACSWPEAGKILCNFLQLSSRTQPGCTRRPQTPAQLPKKILVTERDQLWRGGSFLAMFWDPLLLCFLLSPLCDSVKPAACFGTGAAPEQSPELLLQGLLLPSKLGSVEPLSPYKLQRGLRARGLEVFVPMGSPSSSMGLPARAN